MVLNFLSHPRSSFFWLTHVGGVDGQEPGTKISEPGRLQKSALFHPVPGHGFKPNITSFQSQLTLPSLFGMTEDTHFVALTLLPTPNLVLGKPDHLPHLVGDVLRLLTHRVRETLQWNHLLSPPGCPIPTVHHHLLGEEPAIGARTAVPAQLYCVFHLCHCCGSLCL